MITKQKITIVIYPSYMAAYTPRMIPRKKRKKLNYRLPIVKNIFNIYLCKQYIIVVRNISR